MAARSTLAQSHDWNAWALHKRMAKRGFRDDDPLFIATLNAERAVYALYAQTQLLANPGPYSSHEK
jgi:hypothetical protein